MHVYAEEDKNMAAKYCGNIIYIYHLYLFFIVLKGFTDHKLLLHLK